MRDEKMFTSRTDIVAKSEIFVTTLPPKHGSVREFCLHLSEEPSFYNLGQFKAIVYSIGGFECIFINLSKKCSILTPDTRVQKTTLNLLKIHLKGKLTFGNGAPQEGATVHKPMVKLSGASRKCYIFFFIFSKYG